MIMPIVTELLFNEPYRPKVDSKGRPATFDEYKNPSMPFPITAYIVFVDHPDVGPHAPRFKTIDEAEKFANDLRALTNLTVSEPIPEIATESMTITREGITHRT